MCRSGYTTYASPSWRMLRRRWNGGVSMSSSEQLIALMLSRSVAQNLEDHESARPSYFGPASRIAATASGNFSKFLRNIARASAPVHRRRHRPATSRADRGPRTERWEPRRDRQPEHRIDSCLGVIKLSGERRIDHRSRVYGASSLARSICRRPPCSPARPSHHAP